MEAREEKMQAGYDLYLHHQGVVVNAVRRIGIRKSHPEFAIYNAAGIDLYVAYYVHYQDALDTQQAVEKFNRIAGKMVYLSLLRNEIQREKHQNIERDFFERTAPKAPWQPEVSDEKLDTIDQLAAFMKTITPVERKILAARLTGDISDAAIARQLHVSRQFINKAHRQLAERYKAFNKQHLIH